LHGAGTTIPFSREISRSSCKGVGLTVLGPGTVCDFEVIFREIEGPTGLASVEEFLREERLEVMVVGENGNSMFRAVEIDSPFFESEDDSEEFLIAYPVVAFGWG
jgi:hypothetical protein